MDSILVNLSTLENLFVTPKSILIALMGSFADTCRAAKNLSRLTSVFPAKVEQGHALPSSFSSRTANECPLCGLFNARFVCVCGVWCVCVCVCVCVCAFCC